MNLVTLRESIDALDQRILGLLNNRAGLIVEIGKAKAHRKHSIYVPHREMDVYRKVLSTNTGPLPERAVKAIFREIMSASFQLERPLTIAYLGPEYTFTHLASMKKFGSSVSYVACETIKDVFTEVERERADYGVVPIENSIEGGVTHALDMFVESDLKVCSEVYLEICHNLLSRESDMRQIKKIYSHRQVFGQCRLWLEAHLPCAELIEVSSTSRAALVASKEKRAGCIASVQAGKRYGLNLLARSIEDSSHNVTRFLVVGRTEAKPTKDDKTSIMVSIKDKVGALHDILVPFKKHKINMTKIESRPSKTRAWEYFFFIDMKGHHLNKNVARLLEALKKESVMLKILGSYPSGNGV